MLSHLVVLSNKQTGLQKQKRTIYYLSLQQFIKKLTDYLKNKLFIESNQFNFFFQGHYIHFLEEKSAQRKNVKNIILI